MSAEQIADALAEHTWPVYDYVCCFFCGAVPPSDEQLDGTVIDGDDHDSACPYRLARERRGLPQWPLKHERHRWGEGRTR